VICSFVFIINTTINYQLKEGVNKEIRTEMNKSVIAYQLYEKQQRTLLQTQARILSDIPFLKATLLIPGVDKATVEYAFNSIELAEDMSLFALLDEQGNIILDNLSENEKKTNSPLNGVNNVINGDEFQGYWYYLGDYYQIAMSPIVSGQQLAGIVAIGQKITDFSYLESIEKSSGAKVLLAINQQINTSLDITTELASKLYSTAIPINDFSLTNLQVNHNNNDIMERHISINIRLYQQEIELILYRNQSSLLASMDEIQRITLLASIFTILFGIICSWYISNKISSPIIHLKSAVQSYGSGNRDISVQATSNDEVGDLTTAFNTMVEDLHNSQKDLLNRKEAEEKMRNLAYYDALTGLPNRRYFFEKLNILLPLVQQKEQILAVLFIDIDNFKRINDSLGHALGDELLQKFSLRLKKSIRDNDILAIIQEDNNSIHIARLAGDEFVIIFNAMDNISSIKSVTERVVKYFNEPIVLNKQEIYITGSVGVSITTESGFDSETLVQHADIAMYEAKALGKNNYKIYAPKMQKYSEEQLHFESALRKAVQNKELLVYFQPFIDITTNKIIGAEALVRWYHPERGIISPDDFIPLVEQMGLISQLGQQVLIKACHQFKIWTGKSKQLKYLSVNFSVSQFEQMDIYQLIVDTCNELSFPPEYLQIEITESLLIQNSENIENTLQLLKSFGVKASLDDFGTGYSSLLSLSRLPIETLKIDKSFISALHAEDSMARQESQNIISTILAMADNLHLNVVAEGIETEEDVEFLCENKVKIAQGYYFSKPLPTEKFDILLDKIVQKKL
jgi:diguanylate cyclase (GGDEF)-like protein